MAQASTGMSTQHKLFPPERQSKRPSALWIRYDRLRTDWLREHPVRTVPEERAAMEILMRQAGGQG